MHLHERFLQQAGVELEPGLYLTARRVADFWFHTYGSHSQSFWVKRLEEELWFRDCDAGLPITRLGSVLRIDPVNPIDDPSAPGSLGHHPGGRRRRRPLSTASWRRTKAGWGGCYQEKVVACNQTVFKHLALVRGLGQPLRAESAFRCNAEQFPPGVRWAIHVSPPQEGGYPQKLRIRVRCRSLWA